MKKGKIYPKPLSRLKIAVEETEDVRGDFKEGLGAVENQDKKKFTASDTHKFTGSLNIDASTSKRYPDEQRWDYAIEYNKETFFVEVHPGFTSDVEVVLRKLEWLKKWLKGKAPKIDNLKPKRKHPYYWVFTKRFNILPQSKYMKKMSQKGLMPIRQWDYDKLKSMSGKVANR